MSHDAARGKRRAPSYLRYAADSQVAPMYRLSLEAHGLIALMRDCQWLADEDSVPADPVELALLIRRPVEEVTRALPAVLQFFDRSLPGCLFDAPLREYKAKVKTLSKKLSDAGGKGNKSRWGDGPAGDAQGDRSGDGQGDHASDRTLNPLTPTSTPLAGRALLDEEQAKWVGDLNRAETAREPRRLLRVGGTPE